jgi:lysine 2,3-aminomutase
VIDAPGGGGKVPINPDYVLEVTDEEIVFRNYENEVFRYPLKSTPQRHKQESDTPKILIDNGLRI